MYSRVFEYDVPLFNPEPCKFEFMPPEECEYSNPWKESFRQLYKGVHVRPGYDNLENDPGRRLPHFDRIQDALDYSEERGQQCPRIFIHAGTYRGEFLVIDSSVALIGSSTRYLREFAPKLV